jgi:hypothetical protein
MQFTVIYNSYDFIGDQFLNDQPANLTVTGTVVWDSEAITFLNNGVNSHFWEFISFEAVGVGSLDDGTNIGFTISNGPTDGNPSTVIQSVHSPSQNASNVYWRSQLTTAPSGFSFGTFNIHTFGLSAMPEFGSLLPCRISEYENGSAFEGEYFLSDSNLNSYSFTQAVSVSTVISEYTSTCSGDFNGDGHLNFLDISAFLSAFSAGCP